KIIEPGGVKTDFATRSLDLLADEKLGHAYQPVIDSIMQVFSDPSRGDNYSTSEQLAEMIFAAATDESDTMRYICGQDAEGLWALRQQAGDDGFRQAIRQQMLGQ
ncbi:MAG: short-chain dehydrogenase/reductase, partial [Bacteroidota bacterium]